MNLATGCGIRFRRSVGLLGVLFFALGVQHAFGATLFLYQGDLFELGGTSPLLDTVDFDLGVYSPDGTCLLYEELHSSQNLIPSSGHFSLSVGSATGSPTRTGSDPGLSMSQVFSNLQATGVSTNCPSGYTPGASDLRLLRVKVTPHSTMVENTLSPDLTIGGAPQAAVADSVQGLTPIQLVQISGNAASYTVTKTQLDTLLGTGGVVDASALHNHDSLYAKLGASSSQNLGSGGIYSSGAGGFGLAAPPAGTQLGVLAASASTVGEVIQAASGQTADLLDIKNSSGTVVASVDASGRFVGDGSQLTNITATTFNPGVQAQATVFAGPASGSGAPSFRTLNPSDIPWSSPGAIGTGTPSGGTFTNLGVGGNLTVNGSVTTTFAPGSVLFIDGSRDINVDVAAFTWDAVNHRLGLVAANPASTLHIGTDPVGNVRTGDISMGVSPFDGLSANHFVGSAGGTGIAINTAPSFSGNFADFQAGGTSKFSVDSTGNATLAGTPTASTHAATKGYVDTKVGGYLPLTGGAMSGAIAMSSNAITGLATPVNPSDAATKSYVDGAGWLSGALISSVLGYTPFSSAGGTMTGPLLIHTPTSPDPFAQLMVTTTGTLTKGIVVQGVSGQTGNLQEWQNFAGTILAHVDAFGSFHGDGSGLTGINATGFTGSLSGDVTGTQGATVVALVGGLSASAISTAVTQVNQATSLGTPSTLVSRDGAGGFAAGTIAANLTGAASLNVLKAGDTMSGTLTNTAPGGPNTPAMKLSGTPFIGGSTTTTKPQLLIEDAPSSNFWNTAGTYLGINAAGSFGGSLIDAQINSTSKFKVDFSGNVTFAGNLNGSGAGLTGLPAANVSGILGVSNGGTGSSAVPLGGQIPIGTGVAYAPGTLAGSPRQITVASGAGSITISTPQNIDSTSNVLFATQALAGGSLGTQMVLAVGPAGTVDNSAAMELGTGSSANKGLVIQGKTAQTGNLQEWQNFGGTALSVINKQGLLGIGTAAPVSPLHVAMAPFPIGNFGLLSLGPGPFDGATAGFFVGSGNGTYLAVNAATGYSGDFANFEINGAQVFNINNTGSVTTPGLTLPLFATKAVPFITGGGVLWQDASNFQWDDTNFGMTLNGFNGPVGDALRILAAPSALPSHSLLALGTTDITSGNANGTYFGINGAGSADFANWQESGTALFRVTSNGEVLLPQAFETLGIGTGGSAPIGSLEVATVPPATTLAGLVSLGNGGFSGVVGNFVGTSSLGTVLAVNMTGGYGGDLANFEVNGTSSFKISGTGTINSASIVPLASNAFNLGSPAVSWSNIYAVNALNVTSDARAKTGIKNTNLGLAFLNRLRPVSYRWRKGPDEKQHYGLIAQETEKVLQDFLGDQKPIPIVTYDLESDRYGMAYTELISPIIKAVQELHGRLASVESNVVPSTTGELLRLKRQSAAPVTCNEANDGALALNASNAICVCDGVDQKGWVAYGSTRACAW